MPDARQVNDGYAFRAERRLETTGPEIDCRDATRVARATSGDRISDLGMIAIQVVYLP